MNIKEFRAKLKEDKELKEKFKEAKRKIEATDEKEIFAALSKIAKELGYDVPVSEFGLEKITKSELNDEELEAVAGGRGGVECLNDFEDTDCFRNDFCDAAVTRYNLKTCLYTYESSNCRIYDKCDHSYMLYNKPCSGEYKY